MPFGDGTGPFGQGPGTGRGMGRCGFGRGRGGGKKMFFGGWTPPQAQNPQISREEELAELKQMAKATEDQLRAIQKRIEELERES